MSTYQDVPIDPALRDPSPSTSPVKVAGSKRKTRPRTSSTATSSAGGVGVGASSRVTRRSAAGTAGSSTAIGTGAIARRERGGEEPARGEEENLNGYWGPGGNKRARRESLQKRSSSAHRFYPPSGPDRPKSDWANVSGTTTQGDTDGPDGIEGLAALATSHQNPLQAPVYRFPYPFGLTPFRHPCLTPDHPPPPPGDPNDTNFKPFDSHAANHSAHHEQATTTTSDPDHPNAQSSQLPDDLNPGVTALPVDAALRNLPGDDSLSSSDSANAAYESISALLTASQAYPTLDSLTSYAPPSQ
ncbi:hypothetical protein IAR55_002541 [Kwoniella newhampshirensis]|uniref:Uncharacterized protein n=1 Tax=Kwoniella newhampshirensis TaxID=1651941 RepID=A0AAW0Z1R5_9TREE